MLSTALSENKETIVLGDINCDYLLQNKHHEVKCTLRMHGLKQIMQNATRVTKETSTLIDIIATTHEHNVTKQITEASSISDHDLTGVIVKKNCQKFKPRKVFTRNYAKYNEAKFKEELKNTPWELVYAERDINTAWSKFKQFLKSAVDKHVPIVERTIRGRECSWLSHEIKAKMKERDYHLKKARRTGKEVDWSMYRRLRNAVTRQIRKSKATHTRTLFRESINKPKDFWKQLKKCYPVKDSRAQQVKTFKVNDKQIDDKITIANEFCQFFTAIGKNLQSKILSLSDIVWKAQDHSELQQKMNPNNKYFEFTPTSSREVLAIMKKIKRKVSEGYDEIPASLVIDGAEELSVPLSFLINRCLAHSVFPTAEKCAKITPVHKSDDKTVMDNYRPISILPVLSKVFERIVHNQLYTYLEENNLLSHCQFGFRRKSSTEHAVTYFSDFIRSSMDKGKLTGAVFVDLRKAFDTIDHATLIAKLQIYGVRGKELTWFQSYLFNRQQFVSFQSTRSERQSIRCGVPQGSILGPLLFTIVINDITEQVKKCRILLYADDTVIFTSDKDSKKIEEMLNTEFNNVTRWFTNNNLVLNLKKAKTEFVLFGTHQKLANSEKVSISLNGKMINESELYEYLGVTMDKNLTMKVHLEKNYKKVMSRTKLLARIRNNISPWVAETIYKVMILPQMLYCSNIMLGLSNTHISQFERIRSRALAIINGRSQRVKLPTVNHAINKRCLVEVFKCQNGLAPPLFKNYFKKILHQKETRGNNTNLLLPKVRTEAGRKSFLFQGSKLYNKLPTALKQEQSVMNFKRQCDQLDCEFET